jgi:hypothetical protein
MFLLWDGQILGRIRKRGTLGYIFPVRGCDGLALPRDSDHVPKLEAGLILTLLLLEDGLTKRMLRSKGGVYCGGTSEGTL